MRAKIRKFVLGLTQDLVLEFKAALLNNNMDISRLLVYMH